MIQSVKLNNFLSFGPDSGEIELHPLNVIIGRNGSGKSNFFEAIDLLRNAPSKMTPAIREGGGVADWLYKGETKGEKLASMEFVVENRAAISNEQLSKVLYQLSFANEGQRFTILDEKITGITHEHGEAKDYLLYDYNAGNPVINVRQENELSQKGRDFLERKFSIRGGIYYERKLSRYDISPEQSILAQRRDPDSYPEITSLAKELERIKLYREWSFGRGNPLSLQVKVDAPNDFIEENCDNMPLILNQFDFLGVKHSLLQELKYFYDEVEDFVVRLDSGTAQLYFRESGLNALIPAARLSDGTLRYLYLLCILLHPTPPSVVCIEEPELGLHPDILPKIGKLLVEASERCQLIVTTHSTVLVDSLTECPECVLVAEKENSQTTITRLNKNELSPWLEKYRLGELWSRGDIGGNIW